MIDVATTLKLAVVAIVAASTLSNDVFAVPRRPETQAEIDCWNWAINDYWDEVKECERELSDIPQQLNQCTADARADRDRRQAQCVQASGVTPDFGPGGVVGGEAETPTQPRPDPGWHRPLVTQDPPVGQHVASGAAIRTGAGLCLDVHAPDMGHNGGRVQVWACNGSAQQTWTYDPAARAVRVASGLCLDVHAPDMANNGGRVQVWACNGAPQQQWTPGANGSLRNAGGLCLDAHAPDQATNGGRVQVWQCNGSQQQRFTSNVF